MLSFSPRGVLDEILNLIESVSEGFPSYSYLCTRRAHALANSTLHYFVALGTVRVYLSQDKDIR